MFWKKMEGLFQNPVKPNRYLHSAGVRSLIVLGIGSVDHILSLCFLPVPGSKWNSSSRIMHIRRK